MQVGRTDPSSHQPRRGGFVLLSVLMFMVLLIVLTSAAVYITRQETRTALANEQFDRAYRLAERGIADMLTNWRNYNLHAMAEWDMAADTDTLSYGNWTGTVWKTGPLTFFLNATSEVTVGNNLSGATRQVGMMARLLVPTLDVSAALTTQDSVVTRGSAQVIGVDSAPVEWTGMCTGTSDKPGIMMDDSTSVDQQGTSSVTGSAPAIDEESTIADSTFNEFGDNTYAELVAMANKTLAPGAWERMKPTLDVGGECDVTDPKNWGDPLNPGNPCGDYYPYRQYHRKRCSEGRRGPRERGAGTGHPARRWRRAPGGPVHILRDHHHPGEFPNRE